MLELLQYDFIIRAFTAGIAIGVTAPLVGIFLVVRRYSLLGDTLAHVSLVGVAAGMLLQTNLLLSALVATIVSALGMEQLRRSRKIFGESVLAIFLSGSLAIAVLLASLAQKMNVNFFSYLFGSIATVSSSDIHIIVPLCLLIAITIGLLYQRLFLISFDEELAQANGLAVKSLNSILMVLSAVMIVVAMRVVGVLLVGALMVLPVTIALQMRMGFKRTLLFAVFVSLCAVISGLFAALYFDLPSGSSIVVVLLILFLTSLCFRR